MRAQAKEVRTHMPDPTVMLDHFQHDLQQLLQRAKDHSNRVLVVLQPWFEKDDYTPEELAHFWHGGVGDASLGDKVTVFYDNAVMCRLFAMMNARAAQVARDLGVECLDLMPLVEPSLKTFYDFSHFTPAGAADVAAAVASVIIGETCSQVPVVARSSNDLA